MTDGIASTNDAERSSVPPSSSWTTSAFSPRTRHTARRRPTVVRGSYVTLSSSTRRTPPPTVGVQCQAQPNGPGRQSLTLSAPLQLHCQSRGRTTWPSPMRVQAAPTRRPRQLPVQVTGALAERVLRLVGLEPALGEAEGGQRPVQDLIRRVQPQRPGERPLRALGIPERDQRVALVEEELTLGVAERGVAAFGFGQPGQRVMSLVEQARDAP